jgi:hypothetical protein
MHNAVYRALCEPVDGGNGKMREVLPMIAFMTFRSNLEIPTPSEGEPPWLAIQTVPAPDLETCR